ncbi:hypothetical protein RFI36_10280 [Acinetobacter gerneri]|uniref:Uncharacterized protein n=1 Tax=Acinetobacter gerneri TaxID=202952 RepID=A0AAW8JM92_9GAMM|nr:hypothetical protein [Acinetobacter gerneri]MDQ9010124.1 hypothetical protein [Acinetobacter gerneri]MDQ9014271.1 hypothetical protein [Acinetobacter gerneri]MDQ9025402.1 hypothetical protein [Acinetobacter gerneri]MDQ9052723.1 hypothetical protein [Acinetobacter gerneri]MDQ9060341.1 hypothetical protein [Acinetobacter gerneri]
MKKIKIILLTLIMFQSPIIFANFNNIPSSYGKWVGYPDTDTIEVSKNGMEDYPPYPSLPRSETNFPKSMDQKIINLQGKTIIDLINKQQINVQPDSELYIPSKFIKMIDPQKQYPTISFLEQTYSKDRTNFLFVNEQLALYITPNFGFIYMLKKQ